METSFDSMRLAIMLAIFMVYLVMASQFESLLHPFVILFSVPFALIGLLATLVGPRVWSMFGFGQISIAETKCEEYYNAAKFWRTIQKSYNIAGESPLTFIELIDTACDLMQRRVLKLRFRWQRS